MSDRPEYIYPDENRWLVSAIYRPAGTPGYEEYGEVVLYDWDGN